MLNFAGLKYRTMKKILFPVALLIYLLPASAQSVSNNFGGTAFADSYDINGTPFTEVNKKEVDGSPFLNEVWGSGSVVMKDGRNFKNIPLQFNLFTNQVYFKKDNITYAFATPVSTCTLSYNDENGVPKTIEIQSGFPEAGNKDASTFYMVLAGGEKFKLLKYSYKIIGKAYNYGNPERNVFQDRTEMYIYDVVSGTLTEIKQTKEALLKAFPQYHVAVDASVTGKGSKMRSDDEMIAMVTAMNK